ncbi:MAG: 50S ribosomal protein L10 [Anaerolineae bacterium]
MAISKEKKQQMVADYVERLSNSQAVIFTDYRGLDVAALTNLRRLLREEQSSYQIIKNTLFQLALEQAELPVPAEYLDGPVAVSYCFEEVPPVAKALVEFGDRAKVLKIRGALLGDSLLNVESVKDLADLPSREILLARLVGSVQGPASSLVSTLAAPMRELVQVLQARAEQAEGEEAAA